MARSSTAVRFLIPVQPAVYQVWAVVSLPIVRGRHLLTNLARCERFFLYGNDAIIRFSGNADCVFIRNLTMNHLHGPPNSRIKTRAVKDSYTLIESGWELQGDILGEGTLLVNKTTLQWEKLGVRLNFATVPIPLQRFTLTLRGCFVDKVSNRGPRSGAGNAASGDQNRYLRPSRKAEGGSLDS